MKFEEGAARRAMIDEEIPMILRAGARRIIGIYLYNITVSL